jgi:hypothetical protein
MYATFFSACMRTIRGWRKCSRTAGQRPIPRPFSATGSTSLEPEPLAHKHAALIAALAVLEPSAARTGRTLTQAVVIQDSRKTNELMKKRQKTTSLVYSSAIKIKNATYFDRYTGTLSAATFYIATQEIKWIGVEIVAEKAGA